MTETRRLKNVVIFFTNENSLLKYEENEFRQFGKSMGKQKIPKSKYGKIENSKVKGFLNILREAEIHAIPKTWGK